MTVVRPCLFLLVALVSYRLAAGSPIFGVSFLCSLMCDDYDDSSSDDSMDDILSALFDPCTACPSSQSDTETHSGSTNNQEASAPAPSNPQVPFNVVIPPATGVNVSLENVHGTWSLNLWPWSDGGGSSGHAATPAPAAATTTAAAAGNGTATTAAATTAKA